MVELCKDDAISALKLVEDPELFIDVWTLGLIYEIKVDHNDLYIKMTFTSPTCPYAPHLVADIREKLKERGFNNPELEFTFDPPWEPSDEVKMMLGLM